jgi:hypothetical protein
MTIDADQDPGISIPGVDFQAVFGFGAALGNLADEMAAERERKAGQKPIFVYMSGQVTLGASGTGAIQWAAEPGPQKGRVWLLRRQVISGVQWTTTAIAGSYELYVAATSLQLIASLRPASNLVDESATIPNKAPYSNEQIVIQYGERLHGVVVGGTTGLQYVANMSALSIPDTISADTYVV